jgi:hypothetical protein
MPWKYLDGQSVHRYACAEQQARSKSSMTAAVPSFGIARSKQRSAYPGATACRGWYER